MARIVPLGIVLITVAVVLAVNPKLFLRPLARCWFSLWYSQVPSDRVPRWVSFYTWSVPGDPVPASVNALEDLVRTVALALLALPLLLIVMVILTA